MQNKRRTAADPAPRPQGYTYATECPDTRPMRAGAFRTVQHGGDLKAARLSARTMSKEAGNAYLRRFKDGLPDAQMFHLDGAAVSGRWEF